MIYVATSLCFIGKELASCVSIPFATLEAAMRGFPPLRQTTENSWEGEQHVGRFHFRYRIVEWVVQK